MIPNCSYSTELVSDEYNGLPVIKKYLIKRCKFNKKALINIREMCCFKRSMLQPAQLNNYYSGYFTRIIDDFRPKHLPMIVLQIYVVLLYEAVLALLAHAQMNLSRNRTAPPMVSKGTLGFLRLSWLGVVSKFWLTQSVRVCRNGSYPQPCWI